MVNTMNRLRLLDLPRAWLGNMVLGQVCIQGPGGEQHMFNMLRACTKLQQLLFHQPGMRPTLHVEYDGIKKLGCPLFARALVMAEAAQTKLHLELEVEYATKAFLSLLLTSAASCHPARQPQQLASATQLTCITVVTIAGFGPPLECFLPDVLVQHCPNLQELSMWGATIANRYSTPQLTCTSLKKLSLHGVGGLASAGFKQHLLNLPSLTSLELSEIGEEADYEEGGVFWEAIARYSSQLKALYCKNFEVEWLPWSPTTQLPVLEDLALDLVPLYGDDALEHLLESAPNVKRLGLHSITGLESDFADVPCSWQKLKVLDVYVADLAFLPLSSCTRLEVGERLFLQDGDEDPPDSEDITAGLSAAEAVGGLHFSNGVGITLYTGDMEYIAEAVPILQRVTGCTWIQVYEQGCHGVDAPWSVRRALLAVVGQHLRCERVSMPMFGWADGPGVLAQVPALLPHVKKFLLGFPPPTPELIRMVRAAKRPFTLCMPSITDGLKAQLQQAIQQAGHQLVTLDTARLD